MKNYLKKSVNSLLMVVLAVIASSAQEIKPTLDYWPFYSDAQNMLYKMQCEYSFQHLKRRKEKIDSLDTREKWLTRQQEVKKKLDCMACHFAEKKPLNPVITGNRKGDGFSVELLHFESMPGYKVTAAFFLPEGKRKNLPAILYCSGHSELGFRSEVYQHVIINLVKKGFAVFAFDPVGQGERLQYFDPNLGKFIYSPTHEHSYPGAQLFIQGLSAAAYFTWDGIRAVDYLISRPEIDPQRIGITGRSGGGTQAAYIAAFDDRIKVAAPENYITSFEYLLKSGGPQDAEQNFYHGLKEGIDQADLLEVRAPKPTLMITTTRDIFSIQGARETYQETKKAFDAFGFSENIQMVEDDADHQSTRKNREAMYAFFQQHLQLPGSPKDIEVTIFPPEELNVTSTGQLSTSIGSSFLFDINKAKATEQASKLKDRRENDPTFLDGLKGTVKNINGFNEDLDSGKLIFSGRTDCDSYYLNNYVIELQNERVLPFCLLTPKKNFTKAVLYLDNTDQPKNAGIPLLLASAGITVIIPELPGYGELGPGYFKGDANFNNTSYNQWFIGILNGKSTVAIHAEAIEKILHHCMNLWSDKEIEITGYSSGPMNSVLLHAATFGILFNAFLFVDPLASYESIVMNHNYDPSLIPFTVAGSLPHYDLTDLASSFAPHKIMMLNVRGSMGELLDLTTVHDIYDFAKKSYSDNDSVNQLSIVMEKDSTLIGKTILDFFE